MPPPHSITRICEALRGVSWRDADEGMDEKYVMETEPGILVRSFESATNIYEARRRLEWLCFFAARRALSCWELYCDEDMPHRTVSAIRDWLLTSIPPHDWNSYIQPAQPAFKGKPIVDCRAADTTCAASSAAHAARFVFRHQPLDAVYALSSADMAFDQSPLGSRENFTRWLLDVAVAAAYDCRELTFEEQRAFRTYDDEEVRLQRARSASWLE